MASIDVLPRFSLVKSSIDQDDLYHLNRFWILPANNLCIQSSHGFIKNSTVFRIYSSMCFENLCQLATLSSAIFLNLLYHPFVTVLRIWFINFPYDNNQRNRIP